jgi:predicted oxidoreductase
MLSSQPTPQEINRLLLTCLELGITTLDTAEIYGLYEVERAIGEALALSPGLRDKLEIATKAGIYVPCKYHPDRHTAHYDASGVRMIKSLEKSLRFLGTDHVELLLVHRPDWLTGAEDTAGGLNQLLREGKIRAAGVSNYTTAQFDLLNGYMDRALATNQVEFHLLHMDPIYDGTLIQCEKARISPMAWSPLAGGRLLDPPDEAALRIAEAVDKMSERYGGAGVDRMAYAWILAHPSRPMPIIGTNRIERIRSAAAAADIVLDREDWYALWQAAQGRKVP